jgi:glucosamine--fructose-6-phosphate aminotransferase (isomerizing)
MTDDYYMIGYIREGPQALRKTLQANETSVLSIAERVRVQGIRRIILTGLGSSYTAAMMASPIFTNYCPLPVTILPATELSLYKERLIDENCLVISISRSGERGAVVDAVVEARKRKALGIAITGSPDSLLAGQAQLALITQEGAEITFPKTKSVLACAGLLMRLGLSLAAKEDKQAAAQAQALAELPEAVNATIQSVEPVVRELIPSIQRHELIAVTGSGSNIGVALEAAIKIQEAAYLPTRGESTISLVHGPTGALNARWLVVPLVTHDDQEVSTDLLKLCRKFGAHSLCIQAPDVDLNGLFDFAVQVPVLVDPFLSALVYLPPIQLLTYYWTVARNMNPDAPTSMHAILDAILPPGRSEPELH